jgi:hypothetical protein
MIVDYAHFGDVITFDTTFGTNKEYRPFGVFVGFNQFKETVVFGAALMYDETFESFKWLFNAFCQSIIKNSLKQFLLIKIVQWERRCPMSSLVHGTVYVPSIYHKMH